MSTSIITVITARGGFSRLDFSGSMLPKFLKVWSVLISNVIYISKKYYFDVYYLSDVAILITNRVVHFIFMNIYKKNYRAYFIYRFIQSFSFWNILLLLKTQVIFVNVSEITKKFYIFTILF